MLKTRTCLPDFIALGSLCTFANVSVVNPYFTKREKAPVPCLTGRPTTILELGLFRSSETALRAAWVKNWAVVSKLI